MLSHAGKTPRDQNSEELTKDWLRLNIMAEAIYENMPGITPAAAQNLHVPGIIKMIT